MEPHGLQWEENARKGNGKVKALRREHTWLISGRVRRFSGEARDKKIRREQWDWCWDLERASTRV
jgi:hypothetical protein